MKRHLFLATVAVLIASIPSLAEAAGANQASLLTASDLEGDALTPVGPPGARGFGVNSAMLASLKAEDQIRRVELLLKSGPAQNGDLRVVQSGKPDPNQK